MDGYTQGVPIVNILAEDVLLPRVAVDVVPSPMVVGELFIVGLAL